MPPKKGKGKRAPKGPPKRKLKSPKYSRFHVNLFQNEFPENFLKCDKDSRIVMAIPMEHLGKALRLCGLTPTEQLIQTIAERLEKQEPVITPPPSDDEEEEDEIVFTDEEKEILKQLSSGLTATEILAKRKAERIQESTGESHERHSRHRKSSSRKSSSRKSSRIRRKHHNETEEEAAEREEEERLAREEEERKEAERIAAEEEEERIRLEEEAAEEEQRKKKKKRELTWPVYRKKQDLEMLAKVKLRFKRFVTLAEFMEVMWAYAFQTQYKGQEIIWAFRTLDPKLDYELEPVWPYGADEPLVPTDEIDNPVAAAFIEGKQERFLEKERRRFIKMADFKKEGFFGYKELVEDYCKEANYEMGVAEKKKKVVVKDT